MAATDAVDDGSMRESDEVSVSAHRLEISDELIDPWCDLCFDKAKKTFVASGFCPECNSFLCTSCLDTHNRFPTMRNHRILQDGRMPNTHADKPAKYIDCDKHKGHVNDHFCMDHSEMVCSQCITEFHMTCKQTFIPDLCTYLSPVDLQDLWSVTETIKKNVISVKNDMEQNKANVKKLKSEMVKEAQELRDKLILKVEKAYSSSLSNINTAYNKKISDLSNQVFALSDMITSLDQTLSEIAKIIDLEISPQVFIKLQNMVANVRHSQTELADFKKQLCKVDLSFSVSSEYSDFLSVNSPLGSVEEDSSHLDLMMPTPETIFPSPSRKTNRSKTQAGRIARDIMQIEATKTTPLNVKMFDDQQTCNITGMAVTSNNLLLLTDWKNEKVKIYSSDNELLSSLVLPGKPYHICMTDKTTAVVSTNNNKLHMLDISNSGALSEKRSVTLGFSATKLASCGNNLAVIKWNEPRCVKMITKTGAEVWSVSKGHILKQLFKYPCSITTSTINDEQVVIVTDGGMETITVLDANRGDVIRIIDVKGKNPHGLTVDDGGNVYVCCRKPKEICVLSADFSRSRVLPLPGTDLQTNLKDIAYCERTDEIFIWDANMDALDRFQLS